MSIDWSESSLCPSTQTSKFTLFCFVIYKKIQDKCAHGLASHDASGEKPGENCFADRVTLGYRRVIAFEKMLLPRAAFEKKLLAGTLSLISKVTAEHFVRMSKFELDHHVCSVAYLLHVGNDLIALLVARPRRHIAHNTLCHGRVGLVVDELV